MSHEVGQRKVQLKALMARADACARFEQEMQSKVRQMSGDQISREHLHEMWAWINQTVPKIDGLKSKIAALN